MVLVNIYFIIITLQVGGFNDIREILREIFEY